LKEELEFYDIKMKTKFKTSNWRIESKEAKGSTRYFAVTKSPSGDYEVWRIVKADFGKANM
jgi:hypothetical protein